LKKTTLNRTKRIQLLVGVLLMVFSFVALYSIHGEVLVAPNDYMLSGKGESCRVYYTLASHAKTDSSYVNFQGMNYPFGEHLVYCDAQPAITNTFRFFSNGSDSSVELAVGFQNAFSFYALILGTLFLYLLFINWRLPAWYAAIGAISLMLIGPQILRMPWQPSLAYFCFIPLLLLCYHYYERKQSVLIVVGVFLINLLAFFINPYLGMMGSGFFLIVSCVLLIRKGWKSFRGYFNLAFSSLLPGILYQLYVSLTDFRVDRISQPTGLHEFTSTFSSVFTSPFSPIKGVYESMGVDMTNVLMHFEGMSYTGLFFNLLMIFFIVRWFYLRLTGKKGIQVFSGTQRLLMVIAVLFLILAMGIPFTLHPKLESLMDLFPPLKQIRALGRMSWMFTLCINVVLLFGWYRIISEGTRSKAIKYVGITASILFLGFTSWEGVNLHKEIVKEQVAANVFVWKKLEKDMEYGYIADAIDAIDPKQYCAVVPIPYYHVGSEQFLSESHTSYRAMLESIALAYHTELPLTACYLSRISRSESIKSLQFFSPQFMAKSIEQDFHDDRPLLLIKSIFADNISPNEKRLIDVATKVYESDIIQLYALDQQDVWKTNGFGMKEMFNEFKADYKREGALHIYGDNQPVHIDFNSEENQQGITGSAYICSTEKGYFFDQSKDASNLQSGIYELSFWGETSENRTQANLILEEFDLNGKLLSTQKLMEAKRSSGYWKDWLRWSAKIEFKDDTRIKLRMEQPSNQPGFLLDELMLLPEKSSVFTIYSEELWLWNNYILDFSEN